MRVTDTPSGWVIIKIPAGFKVFGSWVNDEWKINSGIKSVETDGAYYYFHGYSGSVYKCHTGGYGFASSYAAHILDSIIEKSDGLANMEVDRDDWVTLNQEL